MRGTIQIIYCAGLVSDRIMDYLFLTSVKKPAQSSFKFHKLFVDGFSKNGCKVSVISSIPVIPSSHKKKIWVLRNETVGGVQYYYIPFININYLKHLIVFINSFLAVFFLRLKSGFKSYVVIDSLNSSLSSGSLLACKLTGGKSVGIVTDLPQLIQQTLNISKLTILEKYSFKLAGYMLQLYDCYIFLTDYMNEVVNLRMKPFRVIEGLVDKEMEHIKKATCKDRIRTIVYSGGIYEKFGVKKLIDAFMRLNNKEIILSIYGDGEMEKEMNNYCNLDKRIHYHGVVSNDKVVAAQISATLLVNPRPGNEEFTKYSFPSKNMEYMASGTPVLTTILPGMPEEYYDYVFLFEDESVTGFSNTLSRVLELNDEELNEKGKRAKEFVIRNKNNIIQSKKVIELLHSV